MTSPGTGITGRAGQVLPGTATRCTDEVARRVGRIAVPFVRRMVVERVTRAARAAEVAMVDVAFFERAASF
jgi:hypothetical protein